MSLLRTQLSTLANKLLLKWQGNWRTTYSCAYVKYAGKWQTLGVPANMIVLYDGAFTSGDICDGSNRTPNLLNQFVKGGTRALVTSGRETHDADEHGDSVARNTSTYSHPANASGLANANTAQSSHAHAVPVHRHTGVVNNAESIDRYKLTPVTNVSWIGTGAVFPCITDMGTNWTDIFAAARYLYFSDTSGDTPSTGHTHDTIPTTFRTANHSASSNILLSGGSWQQVHYHTLSHAMASIKLEPTYAQFLGRKYTGTAPLGEKDLPAGTVALFRNANIPIGWERYTLADGKLIRFGTSVTQGGTFDHTHGNISRTTQASTTVSSQNGGTGGGGNYVIPSHTHTWGDEHGSTSVEPVNVTLFIGVKL